MENIFEEFKKIIFGKIREISKERNPLFGNI